MLRFSLMIDLIRRGSSRDWKMPVSVILLLTVALVLAGCGERNHSMPKAADPHQATIALQTVLDKWKGGATPDSLRQESPAIHAVDEDWDAGNKLVSYQIQPVQQSSGLSAHIPAVLDIQTAAGTSRRNVEYLVETDPVLSVVRQDE